MVCTTPCQRQKSHPGKQRHRRLWTASCILATRFPGFQSQPGRGPGKLRHPRAARALFVGRVALLRGRRRVAAPDAAVVMVQRGRTMLLLGAKKWWGGGGSRAPAPPPDAARAKPAQIPPSTPSSLRSATPDVREGKNPRWSQVPARPTPPPNLATMGTGRLGRLLGMV